MPTKSYQVAVHGVYDVNCFMHVDEASGHCFLIDPGAEAKRLLTLIHDHAFTVEKVLLTHGHFDHTGAVERICSVLGCPFYIHEAGLAYLTDPRLNLSAGFEPFTVMGANVLHEGDVLALEANPKVQLQVLHTPGHTPDSVTYYDAEVQKAFVGDTVFQGGIGTWEYPGGNQTQLIESVHRILGLPEQTKLLSGHSNPWTVEEACIKLLA